MIWPADTLARPVEANLARPTDSVGGRVEPAAARLLADASFLGERLAADWVAAASEPNEAGLRRLRRWREQVGGAEALAARLAALGVDQSQAIAALSGARLLRVPEQDWARLLLAHAANWSRSAPENRRGTGRSDRTTGVGLGDELASAALDAPYQQLLAPFVCLAWQGQSVRPGLESIVAQAARDHLRLLHSWLGLALHQSFAAYRRQALGRLELAMVKADPDPGRALHRRFLDQTGPGGVRLWARRPILARLAAQLAIDAASNVVRLLERLDRDRVALADLCGGRAPGGLAKLSLGLGDRHEGGQSVALLTFDCGARLLYRPRRHDGLELLRRMLEGLVDAPEVPPQLIRDDYSWVSYVASAAPISDLAAYHRGAGVLLAALQSSRGTDIHRENVVPGPAGPVVVDAETVAHPIAGFEQVLARDYDDRILPATDLLFTGLRTGLLPAWDFTAEGAALDGAHLAPVLPAATRIPVPHLARAGTDAEQLVFAPIPLRARQDVPASDYRSADWTDVVAQSFALALRQLNSADASARALARPGRRLRLLTRYTRRYIDIIHHALCSPELASGADFELELEALRSGSPDGAGPAPAIVEAELADLRSLDVPYFEYEPATGVVWHRGRRLPGPRPADEPGPSRLSATDVDGQQGVVVSALSADDGLPRLDAGSATAIAEVLLTDLARRRIGAIPTWLGFEYHAPLRRFLRVPVGWSLYDGQAGIALALAAGGAALGRGDLADLAHRAFAPLLSRIGAEATGWCRQLGPGYLHGAAGVVWSLRNAAPLLGDDKLSLAAARLETALARQLLAGPGPSTLDLADGLAGALVVLADPNGAGRAGIELRHRAVEQAIAPARRLLTSPAAAPLADPESARDGTGVAHGRPGIAAALLRVGEATAPARRAWPRTAETEGLLVLAQTALAAAASSARGHAWCSGRSGIDLVRGASGGARPAAETVAESAPHHLCCGLVGAALCAVGADATEADASEVDASEVDASEVDASEVDASDGRSGARSARLSRERGAVIARLEWERTPRYLQPLPAGLHQPGLLQGAAGLALGLLLLDGHRLPNPLAVRG